MEERICKWCGLPISREDCPDVTTHGYQRINLNFLTVYHSKHEI